MREISRKGHIIYSGSDPRMQSEGKWDRQEGAQHRALMSRRSWGLWGLHAQVYAEHSSEVSSIEGQERWEVFSSPNLISWQFLRCIKFLKYPRPEKVLRQGVREAARDIQVTCWGLAGAQGIWQGTQAFARAVLTGVPRNRKFQEKKKKRLFQSISNQSMFV